MIHKPPYNFQRSPKYVQKVGLKFWNRAGPSRNWTRDLWLCSQMLYHYTTELYMGSWRKLRYMKFLVHHCLRKTISSFCVNLWFTNHHTISELSKIWWESWIKVMKKNCLQQDSNRGPLTWQPDALPLQHRSLHNNLEKIEGYEVPSSSLFNRQITIEKSSTLFVIRTRNAYTIVSV